MLQANFQDKIIHVGDTVRVKYNIVEGDKSRVQTYEGIVISMRGRAENKTFTVRRIGDRGIGVERIWPLNAKSIVDVEVVKSPKKVRRAKLYYLRDLTGKMATRV
jgi:large subunit ribosomal protein L19